MHLPFNWKLMGTYSQVVDVFGDTTTQQHQQQKQWYWSTEHKIWRIPAPQE